MQTKRESIQTNSGSIQTKPGSIQTKRGSIQTKRGSKLLEPGSIQSDRDQSSMFGVNSVPIPFVLPSSRGRVLRQTFFAGRCGHLI